MNSFKKQLQRTAAGILSAVVISFPMNVVSYAASDEIPENLTDLSPTVISKTVSYLDDYERTKFPNMLTDNMYGTDWDNEVLKAKAVNLTSKDETSEEKAKTLASWVRENIHYSYEDSKNHPFGIDVYEDREAQCTGYAQLLAAMFRGVGIPTACVIGIAGAQGLTTNSDLLAQTMHAWVLAYHEDSGWYFYDPIGGVTGKPISEMNNYYLIFVDGIAPYYNADHPDLLSTRIPYYTGSANRMYKSNGEFYGDENITYYPTSFEFEINSGKYFLEYLPKIGEKGPVCMGTVQSMESGQLYHDSWLTMSNNLYHAQGNGLVSTNIVMTKDNKSYYLNKKGQAFEIIDGEIESLKDGYPVLGTSEKITLHPYWYKDSMITTSTDSNVVSADKNGKITAHAYGTATITMTSASDSSVTSDITIVVSSDGVHPTKTVSTQKDTTLTKSVTDGLWYVLKDGKPVVYTGVVKATNGKWFYAHNGILKKNYTGLAKNSNGWFYIKNGALDWNFTGFVKNNYGTWYVKNGYLDTSRTELCKNSNGNWYLVQKGKVTFAYNGFAKNDYGTWYCKNSKVQLSYTGLVQNSKGKWYYVKNGKTQLSYSGTLSLNGKKYQVVNGGVVKRIA